MIIYLPLQARLNHMLDYSLPCHMLEIATEIYNNNGPVKFTQHGCAILSSSPFLLWVAGDVLQDTRHYAFWPQIFHTDGVHVNLIRFKPGTLICWQDKNITLQIYIISMEFLRPNHGSLFQKCPQWQGAMKGAYIQAWRNYVRMRGRIIWLFGGNPA